MVLFASETDKPHVCPHCGSSFKFQSLCLTHMFRVEGSGERSRLRKCATCPDGCDRQICVDMYQAWQAKREKQIATQQAETKKEEGAMNLVMMIPSVPSQESSSLLSSGVMPAPPEQNSVEPDAALGVEPDAVLGVEPDAILGVERGLFALLSAVDETHEIEDDVDVAGLVTCATLNAGPCQSEVEDDEDDEDDEDEALCSEDDEVNEQVAPLSKRPRRGFDTPVGVQCVQCKTEIDIRTWFH